MAWDAQDHAVVELGKTAIGVSADMVCVKWLLGEIATAALAFAVSGDQELPSLTWCEETPTVHADCSHGFHSGVAPNPHVISQMAPARRAYRVGLIGPRKAAHDAAAKITQAMRNVKGLALPSIIV